MAYPRRACCGQDAGTTPLSLLKDRRGRPAGAVFGVLNVARDVPLFTRASLAEENREAWDTLPRRAVARWRHQIRCRAGTCVIQNVGSY